MSEAFIERWHPIVFGILAGTGCFFFGGPPPATSTQLLGAVVSVAGIVVGFFAAAQSIIISIDDNRIIKNLKDTSKYDTVLDQLDEAMYGSFILAVMSGVGLLKDFNTTHWPHYAVSIWVGVLMWNVFACYRVIRIFKKILRSSKK